jgi:ABC-type glycerol-3-phosphate transport system substrate-binding protein
MKKRMFFAVAIGAAALATAPLFANGQQGAASSGSSSEKAAPAAQGSFTLTLIGNDTQNAIPALMKSGVYKGPAKVQVMQVPENDIDPKIRLEMVSGSKSYDLAITESAGAREYAAMGLLAELPNPPDYKDFFAGSYQQYATNGKQYGYPILADNMIMYYNKAMLADGGYNAPPATWDDFWKMAKHLTKDANGKRADEAGFDGTHVVQYGYSFKGANAASDPWELCPFIYSNGLYYIDKDYNKMTYKVNCNRPEIVAIINKILDLKASHCMPEGFPSYDYDENRQMLAQGKAAMILDWPGAYDSAFKGSPMEKNIVSAPTPKGSVNGAGPIGGWSINVFKASKHVDEAIKVAEAFTSTEGEEVYSRTTGDVPTRATSMKVRTAEVKAKDPAHGQIYDTVSQVLPAGHEMDLAQTGAASKDCVMAAAEQLSAIWAGQKTAQQGMDDLAAALTKSLTSTNYMK